MGHGPCPAAAPRPGAVGGLGARPPLGAGRCACGGPVRCLCLLGLALGIAHCGTAAVGPRYELGRRPERECHVSVAWRSRWGAAAAAPCRALPDRRGDQIDDIAYWSTCIITYSDPLSGVRRLTQCAGHSSPVGSAFQLSRRPRHSRCYVHRLPWRAWIPSSVPHLQPYTQYWALNKACTLQTCHTISMRVSLEQC